MSGVTTRTGAVVQRGRRAVARSSNRRARERFAQFWFTLQAVDEALIQAARVAETLPERPGSGFVPAREEVTAAVTKASAAQAVLAKTARRWDAELMSTEWQV